jgi:hypothetical protein
MGTGGVYAPSPHLPFAPGTPPRHGDFRTGQLRFSVMPKKRRPKAAHEKSTFDD